jgi:undecaprenyl-diphosphatase
MLEELNRSWFLLINATPDSAGWMLDSAQYIARDLILVMPALVVILWLWGRKHEVSAQRQMVLKTAIALVASLAISWCMGHLFPHARPFAIGLGYNFLYHAPDNSFPSDHGTTSFTFALAFLFWHRLWSGALLMVAAIAIAWSRVYLGVHWPMDMIGALFTSLCGCLIAQLIWNQWGSVLYLRISQLYRYCFAMPIRKGWVRN